MAFLYANENFPYGVVQQLRSVGHDVLTVAEAGNAGPRIPDATVLAYAAQAGRAVLTINRRDFVRLQHQGVSNAGIIACTQYADVIGQAQRIHAAISDVGSLANRLLRVVRPNPYLTTGA